MSLILLSLLVLCCKPDAEQFQCGCNGTVVEVLTDEDGYMWWDESYYFYVSSSTNKPYGACKDRNDVPDSLQIDGLEITFSGQVFKWCPNVFGGGAPFVLTDADIKGN